MPVKVSVNILETVTIGFANEVEEVNQYPAVINNATAIATEFSSFFLTNSIVKSKPVVAIISLTKRDQGAFSTLIGCVDT